MVTLTAAQLKNAQQSLASNRGGRGAKLYTNAPLTHRARITRRVIAAKSSRPYAAAQTGARGARRVALSKPVRSIGRKARLTAAPHVKRATGGIGTLLVLFIGLGIAVAVMRNPRFITAPLSFIGGATSSFVNLNTPPASVPKTPPKP